MQLLIIAFGHKVKNKCFRTIIHQIDDLHESNSDLIFSKSTSQEGNLDDEASNRNMGKPL
jgi:hypothetical protein